MKERRKKTLQLILLLCMTTVVTAHVTFSSSSGVAPGQKEVEKAGTGRTPRTTSENCRLPDFFDTLKRGSSDAVLSGMIFLMRPENKPPKSSEEAAADFGSWLEKPVDTEGLSPCYALMAKHEATLAGKNQAALLKVLKELGYSGHDLTGFLYFEEPFRFCLKAKGETLIISSIVSHSMYNTLRLDGQSRAAKEFHSTDRKSVV